MTSFSISFDTPRSNNNNKFFCCRNQFNESKQFFRTLCLVCVFVWFLRAIRQLETTGEWGWIIRIEIGLLNAAFFIISKPLLLAFPFVRLDNWRFSDKWKWCIIRNCMLNVLDYIIAHFVIYFLFYFFFDE